MTPPPIPTLGRTIFGTLFHLLLMTDLSITTQSLPCDGFSSTADRLATEISHAANDPLTSSWHVHVTVPASVSGEDDDLRTSFDAPSVLVDEADSDGSTVALAAVFHTGVGKTTAMATYAARTTADLGNVPSPRDGWTVTAKLSDEGSMGHLFPTEDGSVFFAYEFHDYTMGNTVGVRLYEDLATLMAGGEWRREVRLKRAVALPKGSDTVTTERVTVRNIGTPTITDVVESDVGTVINFRFHYFPEGGSLDYPGVGYVLFPPSGETSTLVTEYDIWYGRFENRVDDAVRVSGVTGKIGQRAALGHEGREPEYLLYEGQMADAGEGYVGWLSWRPILYDLTCGAAALLPLTLPTDLQTLANPNATPMGGGYLLLSFFVPSEPFDESKTKEYVDYDPTRCPTCSTSPMEVAKSPARSGTFLVVLDTVRALGDDRAFEFKYWRKMRDCAWVETRKKKKKKKVCTRKIKECGSGGTVADCCRVACGP